MAAAEDREPRANQNIDQHPGLTKSAKCVRNDKTDRHRRQADRKACEDGGGTVSIVRGESSMLEKDLYQWMRQQEHESAEQCYANTQVPQIQAQCFLEG